MVVLEDVFSWIVGSSNPFVTSFAVVTVVVVVNGGGGGGVVRTTTS